MRINFKRTLSPACTFITCSLPLFALPTNTLADQQQALSYHADGACYCTTHVPSSEQANTILPTPIGGQSVTQICERVGNGPGLQVANGLYNHPAYSDLQCGNPVGNPPANNAVSAESCTGLSAPGAHECLEAGPTWDLVSAYARPVKVQSTEIAAADTETTKINKTTAAVTIAELQHSDTKHSAENVAQTQLTGQTNNDSADVENKAITLVESAYQHGHTNELAELETVESEPIPAAALNDITETTQARKIAPSTQAFVPTAGDIGPNNLPEQLTQAQIRNLPEIFTEEIPKPVTLSDGTVTVITDTATLNDKGTTVIVIEADGTPRVMTQEEIERLPLANLEDVDAQPNTEQQEVASTTIQPVEPTASAALDVSPETQTAPEPAAAVLSPPSFPQNRAGLFGEGTLDYGYVSLAPTGYDFGGNGAELEASLTNNTGLTLIANASVAEEYTEASIGAGIYFSPFSAVSTDFVIDAGLEFGQFDLGITDLDDSGGYVRAYIRSRPFRRFELTGGGRYSSFFEGDTVFIATGTLQLMRNLNAFSKVEIGDNDQFSLGIRLFY